jgi:hypothetical protein
MTKIQKAKHIADIRQIIESNGFELNRWGRYVKGQWKIEIGSNNLKIFCKGDMQWYNIWSKTMTGLTLNEVTKRMQSLQDPLVVKGVMKRIQGKW